MTDIKPIETIYNGFKFRSRLEARWAVFLDEAQIKYEYELEGFELKNGIRYLPDFYLPDYQLHVEVKPTEQLSLDEIRKIVLFAADADQRLLLIVGTPTTENMYLLDRACLESWASFTEEYDENEELIRAIFWEGIREWSHVQFGFLPLERGVHLIFRTMPPPSSAFILDAQLRAKQARFEHGRHGD